MDKLHNYQLTEEQALVLLVLIDEYVTQGGKHPSIKDDLAIATLDALLRQLHVTD